MSKLVKFLLYIVGVFFSLISLLLFIFAILIFIGIYRQSKKSETKTCTVDLLTGLRSSYLYIPVTINDSIYPFVFDTGSSSDLIDSVLTEKIGLHKEGIVNVKTWELLFETVRNDSVAYVNKTCAIGNLNVTTSFLLNGYEGLFHKSSFNDEIIESFVGFPFMLCFNWLFNFADSTVTVSYANDKIPIPALPNDKILTLDFHPASNSTRIDVTMDGITFKNVSFDTGYEVIVLIGEGETDEKIDIAFSKADFEKFTGNKPVFTSVGGLLETGWVFFIDSLQINDFTMQGIFAQERKDYVQTIFTAQFVRRFRMMHYDSANRKIHLYVSPSDSARHDRRYLRELLQLLPSDESGVDVPVSDIINILE